MIHQHLAGHTIDKEMNQLTDYELCLPESLLELFQFRDDLRSMKVSTSFTRSQWRYTTQTTHTEKNGLNRKRCICWKGTIFRFFQLSVSGNRTEFQLNAVTISGGQGSLLKRSLLQLVFTSNFAIPYVFSARAWRRWGEVETQTWRHEISFTKRNSRSVKQNFIIFI